MARGRFWVAAAIVANGLGLGADVSAQDGGLGFEFGAARAFPPSGTDAARSSYAMIGLRGERWTASGSGGWISLFSGRALDQGRSDWTSADAGGQLWLGLPGSLDLGLGTDLYAFTVSEPFIHRALTGSLDTRVRLRLGSVHLLLNAEGGVGRSVIEVQGQDVDRLTRNGLERAPTSDPAVRRVEQDLWHYGGGPEVRLVGGRNVAAMAVGVYESPTGTYRQATASLAGYLSANRSVVWRVVASAWDTPTGTDVTGGLVVSFPLGGAWSARASGVRTQPSPLIRTDGGTHGGLMLNWQPVVWDGRRASVYSLARSGTQVTAEFTLDRPGATAVEIVGDFTSWQPVTMIREGNEWAISVEVTPGIFHFGFLVDGEWFLPEEGVPGRVSDEWGRDNGTLVVSDGRDGEER